MFRYPFNQLSLLKSDMCGGDENRDVKIEVFESDTTGLHRSIDWVIFAVKDLTS